MVRGTRCLFQTQNPYLTGTMKSAQSRVSSERGQLGPAFYSGTINSSAARGATIDRNRQDAARDGFIQVADEGTRRSDGDRIRRCAQRCCRHSKSGVFLRSAHDQHSGWYLTENMPKHMSSIPNLYLIATVSIRPYMRHNPVH
jgi:hypothetical protein